MKSQEELNVLKSEFENLSKKLNELTEEEVKEVVGGVYWALPKTEDEAFRRGLPKSDDGAFRKGFPKADGAIKNMPDDYLP